MLNNQQFQNGKSYSKIISNNFILINSINKHESIKKNKCNNVEKS